MQNEESGKNRLSRLARVGGWWLAVLVISLLLGLVVAPWICEPFDMGTCWLPWMRASGGWRPWMPYSLSNCNYPPFMLYVWTGLEIVERLARVGHGARASFAITLIKLPNLLAYAAGVILCARGLRLVAGTAVACSVAVVYALCLPVWFNAAVWGQCDAMLSLAMLAVVIALLNDRPITAGACVGWALAIKLQAIVIIPAAVVYAWRRFGLVTCVRAAVAGFGVLMVFVLPMEIAGYGHQVRLSYTGAVGLYPVLSQNTFNPWSLVTLFNIHLRHLPMPIAVSDSQHWFGPITPKRVGLLAFASFTAWLMIELHRRPSRYNLALTSGLTAYGFFMLSTQMHERYVIPAAALLAVCAVSGGGRIYLAVMIPAMLTQLKGMTGPLHLFGSATPAESQRLMDVITVVVSSINLWLFVWVCWEARRQMATAQEI